jgi:hypothetical protein
MDKWEYTQIKWTIIKYAEGGNDHVYGWEDDPTSKQTTPERLNLLGEEGWELSTASLGQYILKRRKLD